MLENFLFYIDDCPSCKPALENLKSVIEDGKVQAALPLIKIEDSDHAQREKFLRSPSIRINGIDLWSDNRDIKRPAAQGDSF